MEGTLLADRYLLGGVLGSGGTGSVWRATDLRTGGLVAVKLPHPHLARDPTYRQRLRREAELAASLTSPRVVRVVDFFEHQQLPALVLEYVSGETLHERLAREGRLPIGEALAICLEVARALEAAHAQGIEHRDLKPQNVKLVDGQVKVLDFGLARAEGDAALTQSGAYLGTPAYSAPERISGDGDARSDLYSLGVMLYQLLEGWVPFSAPTPLGVLRLHEIASPPPLIVAVPEQVQDILDRCLAKQPEDRFQGPSELCVALEAALAGLGPAGPIAPLLATQPLPPDPSRASGPRYDVFLSHDPRDGAAVQRIAERLGRARLRAWSGEPGDAGEGIRNSAACAVFVGPAGLGDWARLELGTTQERAAGDRAFRVLLVLLPGVAEPFAATCLPPFLSTRPWVDLRGGAEDPDGMRALVGAIRGAPLAPASAPAARRDVCPYRGLQTFDEGHAEFFFGRTGEVQRLLERLKEARLLAVLGPSGSGKSSLVRAGLIPALRAGGLDGSERWTIRTFTPGPSPLAMLTAQLLRLYPGETMQRTLDLLASDSRTLHLAVALAAADRPNDERVAWVVDQFEEVFTLCRDEQEQEHFFANLLYACSIPGGRNAVVLTMRADFYPRCAAHAELAAQIAAQQFLVSPMDADGVRQVVEEPARHVGLEFEGGLVDTILEDVANQPGALPLLEHALLELWERRRGAVLTLGAYRESGGVQGALARRADAIYGAFEPRQQQIARRVLLRLTQPGEGTEDTRRRATLGELVTRPDEADAVEAVVRHLADARLLTTGVDGERPDETAVDISHEALIRNWPRLRQWIDDGRAALRTHRQLTEAAREWQRLGRDEGLLYRGGRLAEAVEWRVRHEDALNDQERAFLRASQALRSKEQASSRRRLRLTIGGLASAVLVISVLALLALSNSQAASQQRDAAVRAETNASSRELAASSMSRVSADPELAVLLAVEAVHTARTVEAEDALTRSLLTVLESNVRFVLRGHTGEVFSAEFSPDGRLVVTASADSTARIWDAASGQPVRVLSGHTGAIQSAGFSPDGRLVATASEDGTARIWDAASGQAMAELRGHSGRVWTAAFSPDGRLVATASEDGTARLWDAASGQPVRELRGHAGNVHRALFSPDGRLVVTASADSTARIWDATTGQAMAELRGHAGDIFDVGFSPDGRLVVTAGEDGTTRLWDTATGQTMTTLIGHRDRVLGAEFSPDGKLLATTSRDGTTRLWDVHTGQNLAILAGHVGRVWHAIFSPDGRLVATAGEDGTARLWDAATGQSIRVLHGHTGNVHRALFSPDAKFLITPSQDSTVRIWAVGAAETRTEMRGHTGQVADAAFSPDGRLVATASEDGTTRLWDAASGQPVRELRGHAGNVHRALFSPDGRLVVTASADSTARIWDATTGQAMAELRGHAGDIFDVGFSPDGRLVVTAGEDGTTRLWDTATGQTVRELRGHAGEVFRASFSPDGRLVVTASADSTARIWDATTGQTVRELRGHAGEVFRASFSPDGRQVVTAGADGTARLWDVSTGQAVRELRGHSGKVNVARFSPDGRLVVTAGRDGAAWIWDAATGASLAALVGHRNPVASATFSANGSFLVTASNDGTARVWDSSTGRSVLELRATGGPVFSAMFSPDGQRVVTTGGGVSAQIYACNVCRSTQDLLALAESLVSRKLTPEEREKYLHESSSDPGAET